MIKHQTGRNEGSDVRKRLISVNPKVPQKNGTKSDGESLPVTDLFAVHLDVSHVVLKHGGHVDFGELVLAEDDQQAGLSTSSIPHDHQLLTDGRHPCRRR